jgi:hypothetical protein
MLQDDFLLRQIQQFVQGMARSATQRKEELKPGDALLTVDDLIEDLMHLKFEVIERLDAPSLIAMLSPADELDGERTAMLGLALEEKARLLESDEPGRAQAARDKAEALFGAARAAGVDPGSIGVDPDASV